MSLQINTNIESLSAQRHLSINTTNLNRSLEKIGSGSRINRTADDAAGLQISENLRTQIRGLHQAEKNILDGINVLNIVDGALGTIEDNIQRIRELVVQAASDTYTINERNIIAQEVDALRNDIDRIANATEFNGVLLLAAAGVPANFNIQVGPNNNAANDILDIAGALGDMTTGLAGLSSGGFPASVFSFDNSFFTGTGTLERNYLAGIDGALVNLHTRRATVGTFTNQLEAALENVMVSNENVTTSEARWRDTDMAKESASLVQNQILQQSSNTVLAQANQSKALALSLLQSV